MMLNPTGEQLAFKAEVRRFLERSAPLSRTREFLEASPGYDTAAWDGLGRLGAQGLLIPEAYGGAGAGVVEAALTSEEMGRVLYASPYLSSAVLAARLLAGLGDERAMKEHLPGIASGRTVATVAFLDDRGHWNPCRIGVRAEPAGTGWRLLGRAPFVTDAAASLVLVVAATPDGLGVFAADGAGRRVEPLECLDTTQPLSRLDLEGVAADRIGADADVEAVMDDVVRVALACVTAAQLGGAERCLETAVAYAKARVQFGRPIGAFQAIKHRCADMYIRVQSARSAVHHLVEAVRTSAPEAADAAHLAKAYCSETAFACATDNVQIHGGIGFTWEHDAHLYLKRAEASGHLLGDAIHHRGALARSMGLLAEEGE
ncbi:acyl-CoA dehydrogenase family protein [Actinomadura sp. DC4]|uniref:acyl-CoA dehydrogenase family protein n=1 Tax=Actinomadura sp. DC4 TaxID=3055069 RepID=UPI0025B049F8|nr:acyl-CoA dehydrogenase family protein [Actinomadura sp. DC4]MDN3356358.1 acyl-CoA dehydrogenase family protein [Actinomadura sp. DC4]